ncbi:MAG: type VI secretion system contractile sheath large subunit, partial [Phycisphaerales bacterium]
MFESVLEKAPKSRRDAVSEALQALNEEVLKGVPKWDKNVIRSLDRLVEEIDRKLSEQLAAIMHHSDFQKLEGSWRGLHHLVMNSETGTTLKINVLNASKDDLKKDMEQAVEFDQSRLFKQVHEEEFGTPGGEPYGALIGDFEFENHPEDIALLEELANVGSASHCPFISAASPKLFNPDWESFEELAKPRDLAKMFDSVEYAQWNSFRDSEAARYAVLTMPRTLARLPYGEKTKKVDAFKYEEVDDSKQV